MYKRVYTRWCVAVEYNSRIALHAATIPLLPTGTNLLFVLPVELFPSIPSNCPPAPLVAFPHWPGAAVQEPDQQVRLLVCIPAGVDRPLLSFDAIRRRWAFFSALVLTRQVLHR